MKEWFDKKLTDIGFGSRDDWKRFGQDTVNYLFVSAFGGLAAIVDGLRGVDPFEMEGILGIEITVLVVAPFITVFGSMSNKERVHKFVLAFALPIIFGTMAAAMVMYKTQSVSVWMCFVLAYMTLIAFGGSSPQSRETRWGETQPLLEDLPCLDTLLRVLRKVGEKDTADGVVHALLEHRRREALTQLMTTMSVVLKEISKGDERYFSNLDQLRQGAINDLRLWSERLPRRGGLDPKMEVKSSRRRRKKRHRPRGPFQG